MHSSKVFSFALWFFLMVIQVCSAFEEIEHQHLLRFWNALTVDEQTQLLAQIKEIDSNTIFLQRKLIAQKEQTLGVLTSFKDFANRGSEANLKIGKQLISEGKVGCLIVAGGQGSRLNCEGPKGLFPITSIKKKSLFQLFCERVLAASKQAKRPLFLAIMTSPVNHKETVKNFEENHFFGLDSTQVFFFSQDEIPLLDQTGNLFLESPSKIASGPDGNAASLKYFVEKGIWSKWYREGVRYLNYVHIDNPLADPFDAELSGFHHVEQSDVVMKCISRNDPLEKLGVILKKDNILSVVEYSEIAPSERDAREPDGSLKHLCGNISIFSFKMDFVREVAMNYDQLPFHKAWKAVKYLTPEGKTKMADKPMAWKFEKFIFDVLPFARSIKALLYPREECFAPLKNASGDDSIATVRPALEQYDRQVFFHISGMAPPLSKTFELDPQFYYPTPELLEKWKGLPLPDASYIDP